MPQLIAMVIVVVGAMIYMFQTFGGTGDKIEGIAQKTSIVTEINNVRNGLQLAVRAGDITKGVAAVADDPATTSVETFDNGTATVNTETCEGLGLDLETVKKDFEPLCTQVNEIVTAESFDEVEK